MRTTVATAHNAHALEALPKRYTLCDSSSGTKDTRAQNNSLSFYLYVDTGSLFDYLWEEEKNTLRRIK